MQEQQSSNFEEIIMLAFFIKQVGQKNELRGHAGAVYFVTSNKKA